MVLRVDLEGKRITGSVGDIVAPPTYLRRSAGTLAQLRAEVGRQIHARLRAEREGCPEYAAEVAVTLERRVDGFAAQLRGRVDGLFDDGERLMVEEVKSIMGELTDVPQVDLDTFALQGRIYGLCLGARYPDTPIHIRVLLVSVLDGSRRIVELPPEPAATAATVDARLRAAIAEAERRRTRARQLAPCADVLRFPYYHQRAGQQELVEAIASALGAERPVLVAAPTGIGKTVSALLPALRHGAPRGQAVFFLTAKRTQRRRVEATFVDIVAGSPPPADGLRALTLRAKSQQCPPMSGPGPSPASPQPAGCTGEACPLLCDFDQRLAAAGVDFIDALLATGPVIDADQVAARAAAAELCPYELSLLLASRVDLVIGDYNHVYASGGALGRLLDAGDRPIVIIDEAHNLFDRARGYESVFLGRASLTAARDATMALHGGADPRLATDLDRLFADASRAIDAARRDAQGEPTTGGVTLDGCAAASPNPEVWGRLADGANGLLLRYVRARPPPPTDAPEPILESLRALLQLRDGLLADEPELVPYVAGHRATPPGGAGGGIGVACVNPARRLERSHRRLAGVIAMSATLDPLPYYCDVLGFARRDPITVRVPSPFPKEHRCVVVIPSVTTTHRMRARFIDAIARAIADIVNCRAGNYVAYLPSFAFLEQVRVRLAGGMGAGELLVQRARMTDADRQAMLAQLRPRGHRLLLAVMGGVFAEGIDLPGSSLIGAIVVSPGLPMPTFERVAMRAYFDERGDGDGFAYAMLYPGLQRVVQAAGRVIRSMEDRGVIALVGRRFAETAVAEALPADWYRYDPSELVTEDPLATIRRFWQSCGAP